RGVACARGPAVRLARLPAGATRVHDRIPAAPEPDHHGRPPTKLKPTHHGPPCLFRRVDPITSPLYCAAVRSGDVVGGRVRMERLGGCGGMGSVWRALDLETGRVVAFKLLHGHDARDTVRFLREGQLIAGLHHPGIVRYVADGQISDTERFLVMEWLEGQT